MEGQNALCKVCGEPLDPVLARHDYDTHPGCETEPWPGDPPPPEP